MLRRVTVALSLVLVLSCALVFAQTSTQPTCCISPTGEIIKPSELYGATFCPKGFEASFEACAIEAPPTDPPTPDFEPKPVDVPGWVLTVVKFFSQNKSIPIPFAGLLGAILIPLIGVLRQLLASFGAKLGPRGIFIATAVLGLLGAFANAASDGVIAGDEWLIVITGLAGAIAAFFGYRLVFSEAAKQRIKNA